MKRVLPLSLLLVGGLAMSCESTTAKGSGGRELTLLRPASQTLRRGETNRVAITVTRDNIPSNVTVRFDQLPKGVKVIEVDRDMKPGELTVNYTLFAANDADLVSNYQAKVTAETADGLSASEPLTLTVHD